AKMMHEYYPYLTGKVDVVSKMILSEEEKFMRTLTSGETMLRKLIEKKTVLEGVDAFKLSDTYGFPIELTIEIAGESHVKVDIKGFEEEMTKQKERARQARSTQQSMNKQAKDLMAFTAKSSFTYDSADLTAKVIGIFVNGAKVTELDEEGEVVFDNTNFYAESGGQVADHGDIINATTSLEVTDVQKAPNKQHLHHVVVRFGKVHVGDIFTLKIDQQKRLLTMRNHSSAHFLQRALIEVLGDHIHQQGSFVNEEYIRFDFSHNEKVKEPELREIEKKVNEYINLAIPEETKVLAISEAKKTGAISLFDEKYGDVVRVVCFGDVSREFCGGTHVKNSLDIGVFAIEYEESIAAGIRRIQARTGLHAYELLKHKETILGMTRDLVGSTSVFEVNDRVKSLLNEKDELHKENKVLLEKQATLIGKSLKDEFSTFNGYRILTKFIPGTSRETLMKLVDSLKGIYSDTVIVLIGEDKEALPIVVAVTGVAIKDGLKAGLLVKELATQLGGSGGGRPDLASGSGRDKSKVAEALEHIKGLLH
ncbi:MAG: alanine--tRNA ligase, partial [Firmicutes bacterium]|nr:alanine--tRNA ligase [Bacillota bacterium]